MPTLLNGHLLSPGERTFKLGSNLSKDDKHTIVIDKIDGRIKLKISNLADGTDETYDVDEKKIPPDTNA